MKAATMRRFAAALMLAVALMLAYPTVGTIWENQQAREAAVQQAQQAETLKRQQPEKVEQALRDAHAYNQSLAGVPLADPYTAPSEHDAAAYDNYLHQLADTDVMARIRVPNVSIDLPVHHGTSDEAMRTAQATSTAQHSPSATRVPAPSSPPTQAYAAPHSSTSSAM